MKRLSFTLVFIILCSLAAGCGSKRGYEEATSPSAQNSAAMDGMAPRENEISGSGGEHYDYDSEEAVIEEAGADTGSASTLREEKIVKTGEMDLKIADYKEAEFKIKSLVRSKGGYIEESNSFIGAEDLVTGYISIRIPSGDYEEVKSRIEELGRVERVRDSTQNMTEAYYDIESRLKTKQIEEERLLHMLSKAEKIEDLIAIEARLSDVRTEIELFTSQMKGIDRLSDYSTLHINIEEVSGQIKPVSQSLPGRMKDAFIGSINIIIRVFEAIAVFLSMVIVPALCFGLIVFIFYIILRRTKNKNIPK